MNALANVDDLLSLRHALGIVHHVPGRIRLRLGPAIWDWAQSSGLDRAEAGAWLEGLDGGAVRGIIGARLNMAAASLVIEYDHQRLQPLWWETLVRGEDDEALALVLGLFAND